MKRSSKLVLTIVALVAAALGLVIAPSLSASASPPPNVAGTWTLIQSNQIRVVMDLAETPQGAHQVIAGTASFTSTTGDGGVPVQGNVSGVLNGAQLTFTVAWTGGFEGVYIINAATPKRLNGYGYRAYAPTDFATFTGARS